MRLSIIIPFLNSHEIVRRQLINFVNMDLPEDIEIIFVDDGSDPALEVPMEAPRNFRLIATHDTRPWTWALARNRGAREAKGTYYLMTDGDCILTKESVMQSYQFDGDRLGFRREFGVLDENGAFRQDADTLVKYGLPRKRIEEKGMRMPPHPNNFVIKASLFWEMGGFREDLVERPYPQGEDRWFKNKLMEFAAAGKCVLPTEDNRPTIYMFPNGQFCGDVDYNPMGLFHNLTRKTEANHWYKHPRYNYAS
jgi:glycosyltransferase involved in cell wall biosynthesis